MPGTTLFDLPTELLQKIFEYLDWDRTQCLTPYRPDIINISVSCRDLRKTILPLLFRNVSLRLRWVNGALAEPALVRLQQQCPDLAKHIRCVYVETFFGHFHGQGSQMTPFCIPKELQQWLDSIAPIPSGRGDSLQSPENNVSRVVADKLLETPQCKRLLQHAPNDVQSRFNQLAYSLSNQILSTPRVLGNARVDEAPDLIGDKTFFDDAREEALLSTGTALTDRNESRDVRFQLDAFFVLLLCFPSRLTCLVFESLPSDRMDILQNKFALHLAAWIFKLYGGHIKQLTLRTSPNRRGSHMPADERGVEAQHKILGPALTELTAVQCLTLAADKRPNGSRNDIQDLGVCLAIADQITHLDLRQVNDDPLAFVIFIEKFPNLQRLSLNDLTLYGPMAGQAAQPQGNVWLSFLIDLRRKLPYVGFDFSGLDLERSASIPVSGVRWLQQEAVPKGADIGFERETRLLEDFESFILLWAAEDSYRGRDACEARKDGKLVDLAMSSRWRGLFGGGRH